MVFQPCGKATAGANPGQSFKLRKLCLTLGQIQNLLDIFEIPEFPVASAAHIHTDFRHDRRSAVPQTDIILPREDG